MIYEKNFLFSLNTNLSTYLFRVTENKQLEHLYYGRRLKETDKVVALYYKSSSPDNSNGMCLEYSPQGTSDFKETALLVNNIEGLNNGNLSYKEYRIIGGKPRSFSGLPQSYGDNKECSTLVVTLEDSHLNIKVELFYTVFYSSDVISRKAVLTNTSNKTIEINKLSSMQLDFPSGSFDLVTNSEKVKQAELHCGSSAIYGIPLFLKDKEASNNWGNCYAFNLIYSSNHCKIVEKTPNNKVRILAGLNSSSFKWSLKAEEKFETPEAVMAYSHRGLNGVISNFHAFVKNHITRGQWQYVRRPVIALSSEYDYSERELLSSAKTAKEMGAELFILEDGWFDNRNDNQSGLGNWQINTKKITDGLASFSKKIHSYGLLFGRWVEMEAVSKESEIYKNNRDWIINSELDQSIYLLDLTNPDVSDYIFNTVSSFISVGNIDYLKWDMNQSLTNDLSFTDGFAHRYFLALFNVLERITKTFPKLILEMTSSKENRFDLGFLCFSSQMSVSRKTDLFDRLKIQEGILCSYPQNTTLNIIGSSFNPQTLRLNNFESSFNSGAFGLLGYQMNFNSLSKREKEAIKKQIEYYKLYRDLFQFGEFFSLESGENRIIWALTNQERSEFVILYHQTLAKSNSYEEILKVPFADSELIYAVTPRKEFLPTEWEKGLNAKDETEIKLESEIEYYIVSGDILAYHGIRLNDQYSGNYNRETRILGDFGSRLYHFKALNQ
jgi:alpha-galactosidase